MHKIRMGLLPNDGTNVSGAIVFGEDCNPGMNGVLIYLKGGNELQDVVNRFETIHSKISVPKTQISEDMGYFAIFIDSEGNRIGLHSMTPNLLYFDHIPSNAGSFSLQKIRHSL